LILQAAKCLSRKYSLCAMKFHVSLLVFRVWTSRAVREIDANLELSQDSISDSRPDFTQCGISDRRVYDRIQRESPEAKLKTVCNLESSFKPICLEIKLDHDTGEYTGAVRPAMQARTKHSPFKRVFMNETDQQDIRLGMTTFFMAADPTVKEAIRQTQEAVHGAYPDITKLQDFPHGSLAALILDPPDAKVYNEMTRSRPHMAKKVAEYLREHKSIRARIEFVQLTGDHMIGIQLKEDPAQTEDISEEDLVGKLEICSKNAYGENQQKWNMNSEKRRFESPKGSGKYKVTSFQKFRLDLCPFGAEVKGFHPATAMHLVNIVSNPESGDCHSIDDRIDLWKKLYEIWKPFTEDTRRFFEWGNIKMANYVERSLDAGTAVLSPVSPDSTACPLSLDGSSCIPVLRGLFVEEDGNVIMDEARYTALAKDKRLWQSHVAKVIQQMVKGNITAKKKKVLRHWGGEQ